MILRAAVPLSTKSAAECAVTITARDPADVSTG
jgi:hypothetical protein